MSLSTPQIKAQLEAVLGRDADATAIAMRSPTQQPWPETIRLSNRQFELRWCDSPLALREALLELEQKDPASAGLVVLTPLATNQVADDIAARLSRGRIFEPQGWDIVRQLFQAKEIDARLGRYSWMPQLLIETAAQRAYAPVASGFLDLDTAWREVLDRAVGITVARPDAQALLQWSIQPSTDVALNQLPPKIRADVLQWLAENAGAAGGMVLACVESARTAEAVALGLVCGVVFASTGEGQAALGQAAIRLERFVGDKHVGIAEGRAWAAAAEQLVRSLGTDAMRGSLDRADALLTELRIGEFAQLSHLLPAALDQRLRQFAVVLAAHVSAPSDESLAMVEDCANRILQHGLAATQPQRMDRVEMARRIARWLRCPAAPHDQWGNGLTWQADQGAFVDWARFRLLGGDELPAVSQAYSSLRQAVIDRRNPFARQFSQALQQWNTQAAPANERIVLVESVLDRVVAPILTTHPVMLLVMDGLSISIFRELFARMASHGWSEMVRADIGRPLIGVAAFPTITEVSRASLLCGRLTIGVAAQEKTGFASHPALLARSRADVPPKLFHKGDLADSTNLSQQVRDAIANPQQKVVGVVYNAVDDHLSGPDQLNQRWALEDLRLLLPLLHAAREARRVVVVTADHGHLLEDGSRQIAGGESDRWRVGSSAASPDEMVMSGGRVVTADGASTMVCLWGESTRYAGRKNGYHGGVSPQEVAIPLSVMLPFGMNLPDWQPAPPTQPEWWELPPVTVIAPPVPMPVVAARRAAAATAGQPDLFGSQVASPPAAPPPSSDVDWVSALFASPIYASQRQLAARVALPDAEMRLLLTSLVERGGKLSRAAMAQRLGLPEMRLGGLLSAARRMLNVDQALVLSVDETTGTIDLNQPLLLQQFRAKAEGGAR